MLVNEFLEQSVNRFPDKDALICQDRRLTFTDIDSSSNRLSNALIHYGLQRQDRVAVFLDNSIESVVSIFGILKAGGIFLIINPQVKAKKLEYILNDCQVKVLITDTKHLQEASDILSNCSNLNLVILIDYKSDNPLTGLSTHTYIVSYSDCLNSYSSAQPPKCCIDIDLASLIYTSGSTGNPKGVMLTHLNMVTAANSIIEYLENTPEDIIIDFLPLSFDYGLYQILMGIKFGGTVVLEKSFTYPYHIINLITKEKVTGLPLVPTVSAILLQLKNLKKFDFSHLRYITNTAQALPPRHIFGLNVLLNK